MKRIIVIVTMLGLMMTAGYGQVHEFGVGVGTSNFLGDLGKKSVRWNNYFGDIDASLFRPAGQLFYRHSISTRIAFKFSLTLAEIAGDDRLSNTNQWRDDGWYRSYRNLNFRSILVETAVTTEFHILKYIPGSMKNRWTPFVYGGVAAVGFNPKAYYHGEWIALQPLGTEGQGLPNYPDRKKYSRIQASIPIGLGFKFNVTHALSISLEMGHRFTFTDYMDDVSTTYVSEQDFFNYYSPARAQLTYALSRRSVEQDVEGVYSTITDKGQPRGNPQGNDAYLFTMVTFSYNFNHGNRHEWNPFAPKLVGKYRRVMR